MRHLKLIAKIFVVYILYISAAKAETKTECENNGSLYGYATTISIMCSYEVGEKQSQLTSKISKSCNAQYGNKLVFNASMAAIHKVKARISEQGRNSVCADAYQELSWYFQ